MMPSAKRKRPVRHMSACAKTSAIQRIHNGETKASVARDIGVAESTLRGWCKNEKKLRYMSTIAGSENKLSAERMSYESILAAAGMFGEKRAKLDDSLIFISNGLTQLSGLSNTGQGLSFNEIAYLNFLAQINNQSTLAAVSGLNISQSNGLRTVRPKQASQSLNDKNQSKLHKSPAVDNIRLGGYMIDKRIDYYSSLSSVSTSRSSPLQKQKLLATATSTTPQLSSAPQASTLTPTLEDIRNTQLFSQRCKFNSERLNGSSNINRELIGNILISQLAAFNDTRVCSTSPTSNNDNVNNNTNNANTPEDLSKPSVRSSPLNQATKMELRDPTSSTPSPSPLPDQQVKSEDKVLYNNNNNIGQNELNDSKLCQQAEAIEHAEHFFSWLEDCSDPTITTADYLNFRNLLVKIKKIDERVKNAATSKTRKRKPEMPRKV